MKSEKIGKEVVVHDKGFGIDAILVHKPRTSILEALRKEDWFKGIILSATYFEHFGLEKLKEYYQGKITPEKLNRLNLEQIILFLFGSGIIDQATYTKMIEIKDARNELVHEPWANVTLTENRGKVLIRKAIECLKALGI